MIMTHFLSIYLAKINIKKNLICPKNKNFNTKKNKKTNKLLNPKPMSRKKTNKRLKNNR